MTFYWIKETTSPKKLIAVHGVIGSIMIFYGLARGLNNISVGGLQAFGVDPGTAPLRSIRAMANRYLEEIKDVQGAHLLGYCWGGLVAFEMSHRFTGKLILIDPVVPLSGSAGDEIARGRVKNRKKPKDPPPFDSVRVAGWDAANNYRPQVPRKLGEALIVWSQDTFIKLSEGRAELRPEGWNKYLNATHIYLDINQKDLFVPPNLARISNIIEGYL